MKYGQTRFVARNIRTGQFAYKRSWRLCDPVGTGNLTGSTQRNLNRVEGRKAPPEFAQQGDSRAAGGAGIVFLKSRA
jgi:hypothetical protein